MRLDELFADSVDVLGELRSSLLDVLIPLAGSGVPYIGVDQVIEKLRQLHSGVRVDRAMVMNILDPSQVSLVKSIEGDRINFTAASPVDDRKNEQEAERQKDKVDSMAQKQFKKELKNK